MERRDVLGTVGTAIVATLAGCSGAAETDGSGGSNSNNSTPRPPQRRDNDQISADLDAGDVFNREYTLDESGRLEYDFLLRDGDDASVFVIDGSELSYVLNGERFQYYTGGEDVSSYQDTAYLEAGNYYVVVTNWDAVFSSINFDLSVETYW